MTVQVRQYPDYIDHDLKRFHRFLEGSVSLTEGSSSL